MQTRPPKFDALQFERPDFDTLRERYTDLRARLDAAQKPSEQVSVISEWNELRRQLKSWTSLTHLKFNQDTSNEAFKQEREFSDEIQPKLTDLDSKIKEAIVGSPHRGDIENTYGAHAFALWQVALESFDIAIEEQEVEINKLVAEYTSLRAAAEIEFDGETYNLSQIAKFATHADRDIRYRSQKATWDWVASVGDELDRIFDRMVELRHQEAQTLGFDNYVELGYKRMSRVDYNRHDVERFRDEVHRVIVPIAQKLVERQREKLGVEEVMAWDLKVYDPRGNPAPDGDHDWMVERATEMFDELGDELGGFFRMMRDNNFLDLKARKNKSGGGFCTGFPQVRMPFVFANFNDTKHDVEVFTHEMGHAFQYWCASQQHELVDYNWPSYESAEIHSMSLEFLTWPHMERFFGDDAQRFREIHLLEGLTFLPYGVAVDHFQHMIYDNPTATPAERKQMWREVRERYLPWTDWGDIDYPANGGRWQLQSHIYHVPFYYIDYTLAQTCAMQFWLRAEDDFDEAMTAYIALCKRGGSAPFLELVESAGLTSPFEPGCLERVANRAREVLF